MNTLPRVYIVLVNWNGWRDTVECLESLLRLDYPDFRVVVCDNDSSDDSLLHLQHWASGEQAYTKPEGDLARLSWPPLPKPIVYRRVETIADYAPATSNERLLLVPTGGNLGFGGGNNVGIRLALADPKSQFVWLLNNDTVLESDSLAQMVFIAMRDRRIGMTGSVNTFYSRPNIVQAYGGGWFWPWRAKTGLHGYNQHRNNLNVDLNSPTAKRLDWISGASMLVSRDFIEMVGEMEDGYFLYYEELDWALRAKGVLPARVLNEMAWLGIAS